MIIAEDLFDTGGCIAALGTFDGVHYGHRAVIEAALACSMPVAVVTSRQNPRFALTGEGGRILSPEKCDAVFEQMGVSAVIRLDFERIRNISPADYLDILRKKAGVRGFAAGFNFRYGKAAAGNIDSLKRYCFDAGLICKICDSVSVLGEPVSSSRIRSALAKGNMELVRTLMGMRYTIGFEVSSGNRLGRKLGFPTINQRYDDEYALPRFGVYASTAQINGKLYAAVTNIGIKPTFPGDGAGAETHIIGFSGDLYGARPEVTPIEFIRDEIKFDSADALSAQIAEDCKKSVEITDRILNCK